MTFLEGPRTDRRRSSASFGASTTVHAALLLWLAITAANTPREVRRSLYDQEIRPYEDKIVWYNLREKLPDIKPAPAVSSPKPPRALRNFKQTLVSGNKDDARAPQMIVTDSPPAELPQPLPLPNVVADAAPPPPPRIFSPPPDAPPVESAAPALPDSPNVEAKANLPANPLDASMPRPQPLAFQPPVEKKPATTPAPELPEAPRVAASNTSAPVAPLGASAPRPQPLPFRTPPARVRPQSAAPITLPEAPGATVARGTAVTTPMGASSPRPQPRTFQTPAAPAPSRSRTALILPDAPASSASATATPGSAPRIPRGFSTPASKGTAKPAAPAIADSAPPVTAPDATGKESMAIAGLDPSKFTEIPAPPPSHTAGFSAAPEVHPDTGASGSNEKAALVVPSLTAGGGVRDSLPTMAPAPEAVSRARLMAELREPMSARIPMPSGPNAAKAMRVSSSPDPRMTGRVVYTMAIQMPNVTSYSGSWMVWFAEHVPEPGGAPANVRPPEPRRKVDPAYIRSAEDDRIEGTVRLAAVIGKDGRVDQIEILSGIDNRLDHSAEQALSKWLFIPATRDGTPIDVDAVFEVPFRLAPKTSK